MRSGLSPTAARLARPGLHHSNPAVVSHIGPGDAGVGMSSAHALAALAALGQPVRLQIFKLLMRTEPSGMAAGAIAGEIGCLHNTLSTHLAILARAGLVRGSRAGRSIVYRADVEGMRSLISFLVTDCCDGHPDLCDFGVAKSSSECCAPVQASKKRGKR